MTQVLSDSNNIWINTSEEKYNQINKTKMKLNNNLLSLKNKVLNKRQCPSTCLTKVQLEKVSKIRAS